MKFRMEAGICALLCILPSVSFGQTKVTTDECVSAALAHNRSIQISEQRAIGASGKVTEAKGAGNPKLSIFGIASDRSDSKDLPLAVAIDPSQNLVIQNFPLVPKSYSSVGVSLTQVIDVSGVIRAGVKAARLGEKSASLDVKRTCNDVVLQTKAACYDVLRSEELVQVAQEAMRNAQIRKDTAQALVDTGISSRVDVVRAEAAISSAQQSIIGSQNAVEVTKSALNRIMGQDVNASIEIELSKETAFQVGSYEEYLAQAYAKRPEVTIASTNLAAAEKLYKVAKRGMSPALIASATAQIDDAHDCPEDRYTTVGLSLIFPLYDGEETGGRRVQAAADIKSARIAVDETKALVALQVRIAYVHIQNSEKKLTTAKKELDQATETLRLSRSRYAEGIANQVELSDAELSFTSAQTNVVNARFELLSSQAELDQALGRYVVKD